MISDERAKVERANGYSWVCCQCVKLHQARDLGIQTGCLAAAMQQECGSPLAGLDFPLYEGPLGHDLTKVCFSCGAAAARAFRVRGVLQRFVGICGICVGMLKTHVPREKEAPDGIVVLG